MEKPKFDIGEEVLITQDGEQRIGKVVGFEDGRNLRRNLRVTYNGFLYHVETETEKNVQLPETALEKSDVHIDEAEAT